MMSLPLSREPHDDPGINLLALQLSAKRTEQAALRSLGDSLVGPGTLVPVFFRTWRAAKDAEARVHQEIRRTCGRVVIPFIPRAVAR